MLDKVMRKLAGWYINAYKRRLSKGAEMSKEEDKLFAYCVLELDNMEE